MLSLISLFGWVVVWFGCSALLFALLVDCRCGGADVVAGCYVVVVVVVVVVVLSFISKKGSHPKITVSNKDLTFKILQRVSH